MIRSSRGVICTDIIGWAYRQKIPRNEWATLMVLALNSDPTGRSTPLVRELTCIFQCSPKRIREDIARLKQRGLIEIFPVIDPKTRSLMGNEYRLRLAAWAMREPQPVAHPSPKTTRGALPENDQAPSPKTTSLLREDLILRKEEEKSVPKGALVVVVEDGFDRIWGAWPQVKRVGKGAAEKAYRKINPDPQLLEQMLAQVEAAKQTEQWLKEGGRFIPHLSTWLNQRRWEDEYVPMAEPAPTSLVDAAMRQQLCAGRRQDGYHQRPCRQPIADSERGKKSPLCPACIADRERWGVRVPDKIVAG